MTGRPSSAEPHGAEITLATAAPRRDEARQLAENLPSHGAVPQAALEGLAVRLDRLLLKVCGNSRDRELSEAGAPSLERCVALVAEIDSAADELRNRLHRSESLNHEQGLQLQARAEESQTDALTQLANRRHFERQFEERCFLAQTNHCPLVVALLDIDHFKAVNDTRGHQVGDAVLRGLAKIVRGNLPPGALASRFGGEEFAILISGIYLDQAIEVIERLRVQIARAQLRLDGQSLAVTVSCGLAQFVTSENRQQLLQRTDAALYASKQTGRNRTYWHDGDELHLARGSELLEAASAVEAEDEKRIVIDLSSNADVAADDRSTGAAFAIAPKTMRANWCDGANLFWYLRQRLTEWNRGGDPFCVLAIDVDDSTRIARAYGPVALHFMMRAQMLHFDAVFRDMDVIARTLHSKVIVVLPRTTLETLGPVLERLRETMERFTYPSMNGSLDYSVSLGATDVARLDDPNQIVSRAEAALAIAQRQGSKTFVAIDSRRDWILSPQEGFSASRAGFAATLVPAGEEASSSLAPATV